MAKALSDTTTAYSQSSYSSNSKPSLIPFNLPLVKAVSETITVLMEESKKLGTYKELFKKQKRYSFYYSKPPNITLYDYIYRIMEHTKINESTLVISLIYLDKIFNTNSFAITPYNIHRLLFVCVIAAIKFNEDIVLKYSFYAKIAGVSKKELFAIEQQMLTLIDYKLFIDEAVYRNYNDYIMHYFMKC